MVKASQRRLTVMKIIAWYTLETREYINDLSNKKIIENTIMFSNLYLGLEAS